MVYFRRLLVNPHVQAVQKVSGKGVEEGISGRDTGGRSLPYFQKKSFPGKNGRLSPIAYHTDSESYWSRG